MMLSLLSQSMNQPPCTSIKAPSSPVHCVRGLLGLSFAAKVGTSEAPAAAHAFVCFISLGIKDFFFFFLGGRRLQTDREGEREREVRLLSCSKGGHEA